MAFPIIGGKQIGVRCPEELDAEGGTGKAVERAGDRGGVAAGNRRSQHRPILKIVRVGVGIAGVIRSHAVRNNARTSRGEGGWVPTTRRRKPYPWPNCLLVFQIDAQPEVQVGAVL